MANRCRHLISLVLLVPFGLIMPLLVTPASGTNIAWNSSNNGSWHVAANWFPAQVPGPSDVASIVLNGTYTVSINSDVTVGAINLGGNGGTRTLSVNGATLSTISGISVGFYSQLRLSSGTVSGGEIGLSGELNSLGSSTINSTLTSFTNSSIGIRETRLTVANGFINRGTIVFAGTNQPELVVSSGTLTNNPIGLISTNVDAMLTAEIANLGAINVNDYLLINKAGSAHVNSGTISVGDSAGLDLLLPGSSFVTSGNISAGAGSELYIEGGVTNMTGGDISGGGFFWLQSTTSATFVTNPTIASLYLVGQGIVFPSPLLNDSQVIAFGIGAEVTAPSFTNGPGRLLLLFGTVHLNVATLTNYGTIAIHQDLELPGAQLFNAPGGTLDLFKITDEAVMTCELINQGTINIVLAARLDEPGAEHQNLGTVQGRLVVDGGSFAFNAGSMTALDLMNSQATLAVQTGLGSLYCVQSSVSCTGALNTSATSLILVNSSFTCPDLTNGVSRLLQVFDSTVNAPVTNLGTMEIRGISSLTGLLENYSLMTIRDGLSLSFPEADHTNSGTIQANGGTFTITQTGSSPSFTNSGTLRVVQDATLSPQGGTLLNDVTGLLAGSGTYDVSATTFINNGIIDPGASPGIMSVLGNLTMGPTSRLNIEIGGLTAGTDYDRLAVAGQITLGGVLNLIPVNGFVPEPGDSFEVVTFSGHSGTFAEITGADFDNDRFLAPIPGVTASGANPVVLRALMQKWTQLPIAGASPTARRRHSAVYAPQSNRMIVFGGSAINGLRNDVWVLTSANGTSGTPAWIHLDPQGSVPSARSGHTAVYDAVHNRMIIYGGDNGSQTFDDIWVLSNADGSSGTPVWTNTVADGPGYRTGHAAGLNNYTNRMVVFGGANGTSSCATALNDAWVLTNANGLGGPSVWIPLGPAGDAPLPRKEATASYDPVTDRLIVYGGVDPCDLDHADAFVLSDADGVSGLSSWTPLQTGIPVLPAVTGGRGVYDRIYNRLVMFGGLQAQNPTDNVLLIEKANGMGAAGWTSLPLPGNRPEVRAFHSAIYDESNRRMTVFGGEGDTGMLLDDVWVIEITSESSPVSGVDATLPPSPDDRARLSFSSPPEPNPTPSGIHFVVRAREETRVRISVYDALGRRIDDLHDGSLNAGDHPFVWESETSGIYFLTVEGGGDRVIRKFVVAH